MFKKFIICLTRPRQIGMYALEKLRNSFGFIAVLLLIAIIPYFITIVVTSSYINDSSLEVLEANFMNSGYDYKLEIQDGILVGDKILNIASSELAIVINPNGEPNPYQNVVTLVPIFEFKDTKVVATIFGNEVYEWTYVELGMADFDFNKIMNHDFLAFHELVSCLDLMMNEFRVYTIITYSVSTYLQMFMMVLISALTLALVSKLFHQLLPYRLRFKLALDCQIISLFGIMLSVLFGMYFILPFGMFLSGIYLIKALKSIVRVEIKKVPKDGE